MTSLNKKASSAFLRRLKALQKDLELDSVAALADYFGGSGSTFREWFRRNIVTEEAVAAASGELPL